MSENPGVCSCDGCERRAESRFDGVWYCNMHYLRMRTHGDIELHSRAKRSTISVAGNLAVITTSNGSKVIIDADDAQKAGQHSWCISKTGYAVARIGGRTVKLHRYLLGDGINASQVIDHINRDKLDNRRANLRICKPNENSRNLPLKKNNTSGYPGIRKTPHGMYNARITFQTNEIHIGNFKTMDEAIDARKKAERMYYGEFAPMLQKGE